jgi:hypothetical protein
MTEFAANCPDKCPLPQVKGVNGDIYRFVRNDPPAHADMRSWADEGRNPGLGDPCGRCALSVLARAEDVSKARKAIPFFRKLLAAKATLMPEHGKCCQSGSHAWHSSLWVRTTHGQTIHQEFSVVAV